MSLQEERLSSTISSDSLKAFVGSYTHPGVPISRINEICAQMPNTPDLFIPPSFFYESRADSIKRSIKYSLAYRKFAKAHNLSPQEEAVPFRATYGVHPMNMSLFLFLSGIKLQGSEAQYNEWMPRIMNFEVIGCYAQTELGHGSNVRGVETEAIYDHATKEFVINSPSVSSYKWWIGALGLTANYALVVAQLKIGSENYGPHPFIVPLRDLNTHKCFEGVEVGDIGPKMGLGNVDNGYAKFTNYRIPSNLMLTRFATINKAGKYVELSPNKFKILYLSLVSTRLSLIKGAWFPLAIALTISIRYSVFRRQFQDSGSGGLEKKLLDYQIQQAKLFKGLGFLYGMLFISNSLDGIFQKAASTTNKNNEEALAEAHAVISLFKVYLTQNNMEFIEKARSSCGGHGYSLLSGLPSVLTSYIPLITLEGDNSILALQAIKSIIPKKNKKTLKFFEFLTKKQEIPEKNPMSEKFHQYCLTLAAQNKVLQLTRKLEELRQKGLSTDRIWNEHLQVEGIDAAESIFHAVFHKFYCEGIRNVADPLIKEAINGLRILYLGEVIEKYQGDLLAAGVEYSGLSAIKANFLSSLISTRKNALVLIEAFDICDEVLNSAIGKREGNPYEEMFNTNKRLNPLHSETIAKEIREITRPKI